MIGNDVPNPDAAIVERAQIFERGDRVLHRTDKIVFESGESGRVAAGERGLPIEGVAIELAAGQELLGDQPLDVAAQIKVAEIGGRRGPCQPDNG